MSFGRSTKPAAHVAGRNASQAESHRGGESGADQDERGRDRAPQELNIELTNRFKELIEGVTDELMQGQDIDREVCRGDAIRLLIAAAQQMADAATDVNGVVMAMLQEEDKMRMAHRDKDPEKADSAPNPIFTFLRV